jgi:hypothetical protein
MRWSRQPRRNGNGYTTRLRIGAAPVTLERERRQTLLSHECWRHKHTPLTLTHVTSTDIPARQHELGLLIRLHTFAEAAGPAPC